MFRAILHSFVIASLVDSTIGSIDLSDTQRIFLSSNLSLNDACGEIATSISAASEVFYAGSSGYEEGISHWASSSTQDAACSFEPGTPEDIEVALQILGRTQTPFAIKGGGHTANPTFSSTEGVQISMARFSEVVYDPTAQTATIGAGLIWDTVYTALEPHGVNVVGGRVTGVGVAGFILGGGYSWHTNQYGLGIDNVQSYELVLPNGTAVDVTETSSPDLFFALRGGLNNFGIVTRFTLKTFPQTQVWGGLITYGASVLDQVNEATANFAANNKDPKAAILTTYNYVFGQMWALQMLFYDAPTLPTGVFDEFIALPSVTRDVETRSFTSFVQSIPGNATYGLRASFSSVPVTGYPLSLLQSMANETIFWGQNLPESVFFVSYDVEPFLPTIYTHNTSPSAYPPDRARGLLPLHIYYAWMSPEIDEVVQDAIRASTQTLQEVAINDHQSDASDVIYANYAMYDTPVASLYGANLPRLQEIKAAIDPDNVMGLTGGFKL